ncbi:MAG TPA: nitroreductase family deazaflavin-dependent oxidoreductase [Solirubrobacteraceae bacterium]|jgi:deazaflavin-dependent oxidoreductase (nitroreductase family)|nr:nitroreductase family deazaflavin-dependent oxidoreductase [Solirubrobacteraceae bacterium]
MQRYSTVRGRRLSGYEQILERFASSRAGAWLFLNLFNPIDRRLLPFTRGRFSLAVGAPVGMLDATGARSGQPHRTPLLYLANGDRVVVVASNGGSPRHPAWYHNVRAHPDVRFLTRDGRWRTYKARVAAGEERSDLWELMNDLYGGYGTYQARAGGREIPVVVLEARETDGCEPRPVG